MGHQSIRPLALTASELCAPRSAPAKGRGVHLCQAWRCASKTGFSPLFALLLGDGRPDQLGPGTTRQTLLSKGPRDAGSRLVLSRRRPCRAGNAAPGPVCSESAASLPRVCRETPRKLSGDRQQTSKRTGGRIGLFLLLGISSRLTQTDGGCGRIPPGRSSWRPRRRQGSPLFVADKSPLPTYQLPADA